MYFDAVTVMHVPLIIAFLQVGATAALEERLRFSLLETTWHHAS